MKILQSNFEVKLKWKKTLRRVGILMGKSYCTNEITLSFLYNIIALETLLTDENDKISKELPKRILDFIGWVFENNYSFPEKFKELYRKRCQVVHNGNLDDVTIQDVIDSDWILRNVFYNIIRHINVFNSKSNVIDFSKKLEAEQFLRELGEDCPKNKSRIKSLKQSDFSVWGCSAYSPSDYEKMWWFH